MSSSIRHILYSCGKNSKKQSKEKATQSVREPPKRRGRDYPWPDARGNPAEAGLVRAPRLSGVFRDDVVLTAQVNRLPLADLSHRVLGGTRECYAHLKLRQNCLWKNYPERRSATASRKSSLTETISRFASIILCGTSRKNSLNPSRTNA